MAYNSNIHLSQICSNHNEVIKQVDTALNKNSALRLQFGSFPNTPSESLLARLRGTIEILFLGNRYNIPIIIWLPKDFPLTPPIPFVEPTPQMEIQVSSFMNRDGQFCHAYLNNWSKSSSNLVELLEIMKQIFGKCPPLLTRAPQNVQSYAGDQAQPVDRPTLDERPRNNNNSHIFQAPKPPTLAMTTLNLAPNSLLDSDNHIGDISQLQFQLYHKLRQKFDSFNQQNSKFRNEIEVHNQRLNRNANKIRFCLTQLEQIKNQCGVNINALEQTNRRLEQSINSIRELPEPGLKNVQFDPNPLIKQLTDLIAEENALEDTYFHLGKALSMQIIDLKLYLRTVRSLAHDQFMIRALIVKLKARLFIP